MFEVVPYTPTIGAEIRDVDLGSLDERAFAEIRRAFIQWKVLFFPEQSITTEEQVAFGRRFGTLERHPSLSKEGYPEVLVIDRGGEGSTALDGGYAENVWHTDGSHFEIPPMMTILRAITVPPVGGDTVWVDLQAVYEGLSATLRDFITGLSAVHDWGASGSSHKGQLPTVVHPLVRTHPDSGCRVLYLNPLETTEVIGLKPDEGRALLDLLSRQADVPEYQCRFRWRPGSVAMWDNRCTLHRATVDYLPHRRTLERITVAGTARPG